MYRYNGRSRPHGSGRCDHDHHHQPAGDDERSPDDSCTYG